MKRGKSIAEQAKDELDNNNSTVSKALKRDKDVGGKKSNRNIGLEMKRDEEMTMKQEGYVENPMGELEKPNKSGGLGKTKKEVEEERKKQLDEEDSISKYDISRKRKSQWI